MSLPKRCPELPIDPPEEKGPFYTTISFEDEYFYVSGEVRADDEGDLGYVERQVEAAVAKARRDVEQYIIDRASNLRHDLDRIEGAENVTVE